MIERVAWYVCGALVVAVGAAVLGALVAAVALEKLGGRRRRATPDVGR